MRVFLSKKHRKDESAILEYVPVADDPEADRVVFIVGPYGEWGQIDHDACLALSAFLLRVCGDMTQETPLPVEEEDITLT